MDLKGRVAIVTGSTRGIGKGIAHRFAREGAKITINGVTNKEKGETVAAELRKAGGEATVVMADVSQREQAERLVGKRLKPSAKWIFW